MHAKHILQLFMVTFGHQRKAILMFEVLIEKQVTNYETSSSEIDKKKSIKRLTILSTLYIIKKLLKKNFHSTRESNPGSLGCEPSVLPLHHEG